MDVMIECSMREQAREALLNCGFKISAETRESMHFAGLGNLDLLLANRRPSKKMLQWAGSSIVEEIKSVEQDDMIGLEIRVYVNDRKREFQDKADIAVLIENCKNHKWDTIREYAEKFEVWDTMQDTNKSKEL